MSRRRIVKHFKKVNPAAKPKPIHRIGKSKPLTNTQYKPKQPHKSSQEESQSASAEQSQPQEAPQQTSQEEQPQEETQSESVETSPQEESQEESQEETQEETEETPEISGEEDIRFPLISSHLHGDTVRTTGLMISNHGCDLVHCNAMPRNLNVGVERAAPRIAAIHRGMLRNLGKQASQRKVAEAFIKRARLGDQNAMAMIAMVRDNAKRGVPNAIASFRIMEKYIKQNPVTPSANMGFDECLPCMAPDTHGAIMLANGPMLTNSRIRNVAASFGNEERNILLQGMRKWQSDHDALHEKLSARLDSMQREILKLGRTLGKARALQIVRHPNGPISAYSKRAAWELGE